MLFWLSSIPVIMLIGLTLTGLGMSVHFPLGIARAIRSSVGHSDRAAALISVGTGTASGLAPFLLGALADGVGTHWAYAIVPTVLVIGIVITRFNRVPLHSEKVTL
jgi:fucose permease